MAPGDFPAGCKFLADAFVQGMRLLGGRVKPVLERKGSEWICKEAEELNIYASSARAIALYLQEFCDPSLEYPLMITVAAKRAWAEIDRLRDDVQRLTTTACPQDSGGSPQIAGADVPCVSRGDLTKQE